jgi:hypothetical protein
VGLPILYLVGKCGRTMDHDFIHDFGLAKRMDNQAFSLGLWNEE